MDSRFSKVTSLRSCETGSKRFRASLEFTLFSPHSCRTDDALNFRGQGRWVDYTMSIATAAVVKAEKRKGRKLVKHRMPPTTWKARQTFTGARHVDLSTKASCSWLFRCTYRLCARITKLQARYAILDQWPFDRELETLRRWSVSQHRLDATRKWRHRFIPTYMQ